MGKYQHHVFVCVNERPLAGRPSCAARGAREVLAAFEHALTEHELHGRVGVTPTGCLGPCFDGPTCVVYPEGAWYGRLSAGAAAEVAESHLVRGVPCAAHAFDWSPDD